MISSHWLDSFLLVNPNSVVVVAALLPVCDQLPGLSWFRCVQTRRGMGRWGGGVRQGRTNNASPQSFGKLAWGSSGGSLSNDPFEQMLHYSD